MTVRTRQAVSVEDPQAEPDQLLLHVVDSRRHSIPNASITLLALDDDELLYPTDTSTTTDPEGKAALKLDTEERFLTHINSSDGDIFVLVERSGYAPTIEWVFIDQENWIRLEDSIRLAGRVLEFETRLPIPGARLLLGDQIEWRPGGPLETVTDSEGRFRLDAVPADTGFTLTIFRSGHLMWPHWVELSGDDPASLEILIPGGRTLRGRVLDAQTGAALAGVDVGMGAARWWATTDAEGRFEVHGFRDPLALFVFRHQEYAVTRMAGDPAKLEESGELLVPMLRGCELTGVVLDELGDPLAVAPVWPNWDEQLLTRGDPLVDRFPRFSWEAVAIFNYRPFPDIRTDEHGRFKLRRLRPFSLPIRVRAGHPVHGTELISEAIHFRAPGESREITLRFPRGGSIRGHVRPPRGGRIIEWNGATMNGTARAQEDGSYRLDGVEPGTVTLSLRNKESALSTTDVLVAAGQTLQHDFVIKLGPPSVVAGRVTYPDGEPVADTDVSLEHSNGQTWSALSGSRGRFRIEFQAPAEGTLKLQYEGPHAFEMPAVLVTPEQTDLLLVIPRATPCVLRVVDASSGQPIPRTDIQWTWSATISGSTFEYSDDFDWNPGPDGSARVTLPAGRLRLTVDASRLGYEPRTVSLDLAEKQPEEVSVRLARK